MDLHETRRPRSRVWFAAVAVMVAAALAASISWAASASIAAEVTAGLPADDPSEITLAFGGDVHFEKAGRTRLDDDAATALGPYATAVLSHADLAMVNLETAVTGAGTPEKKEYVFRAPPTAFDALTGAGVDVASMANNHAMDFGRRGLADTLQSAQDASFPVVGIGRSDTQAYRPYRTTIKGRRIAVLAATSVMDEPILAGWMARPDRPGVASALDVPRLTRAVREAAAEADIVIVNFHWGDERTTCPDDSQRNLVRAVTAAGADVVVGSHGHRMQGGGWTEGGAYVDYGLGNFAFYAGGKGESTESGVLTLTLKGTGVRKAEWTPARIQGGIPVAPTKRDAAMIAAHKDAARGCAGLRSSAPAGS